MLFPQSRVLPQILKITFVRSDKETIPTPRTEAHIDTIKKAFRCDTADVINETFAEFEFVDGIVSSNKQQINIGTVVEFFRAMLAHRNNDKIVCADSALKAGKVETGERPEETLIRELKEELGITVSEPCLAPLTFASHVYPDFHLLMPLYVCRRWEGVVTPLEGQRVVWVKPNRLRDYKMPPADEPLVAHLMSLL